jgi:HEAT repeat protein
MNLLKTVPTLCLLLVAIGCAKSTSHWQEQLKSPESSTRLHAVHSLRERTAEAKIVVPTLIEALQDEDTFIRRDAARALGYFGVSAQEALPALNALLKDREPSVRKAAAQSLKRIGPGAQVKASR